MKCMKTILILVIAMMIILSSCSYAEKTNIFRFLDLYHRYLYDLRDEVDEDFTITDNDIPVLGYYMYDIGDDHFFTIPEGGFTVDKSMNIKAASFDLRDMYDLEKTVTSVVRSSVAFAIMEEIELSECIGFFQENVAYDLFDNEKMEELPTEGSTLVYSGKNYDWKISKIDLHRDDLFSIALIVVGSFYVDKPVI